MMESMLLLLPAIFSFFSGILISWSMFLAYRLIILSKAAQPETKTAELWCVGGILVITALLFSFLFIFTEFAAFHMSTIIFFEIWYAFFLYRISATPWNTPCHILHEKSHTKNSLIHF